MTAHNQTTPLDAFVTVLKASGLLRDGGAAALAEFLASDASRGPAERRAQAFGDDLVCKGLLTRWQCDRVLEGRHIGFFVEQYKVLCFVRSEAEHTVYLAEDPTSGRQVHVLSTPPPCSPDGRGHIRIVEID